MEKLTDIRLVLADLDGTLLKEDKSFDSDIIEVRKQLKAKGIEFSFASGRNMHIMQEYVNRMDIEAPYITNNGANMFVKQECIYECSIVEEELRQTLILLQQKQIPFIAYSNFVVYPFGSHPALTNFLQRLIGKSEIKEGVPLDEVCGHSIFKVVLVHEDAVFMDGIMKAINKQCSHTHCVRSEGDVYTLTHLSASKGSAVQMLLEKLKVDPNHTLVFGDNYNDTPMFDVVKYSVAMGNAIDDIKAKATFVTKSNEENGVSWFLKTYVLP